MTKIIKSTFWNFLVICLIFLTTLGWFFSGWPQIWQEPSVPPKIQEIKASPESLILLWDGAGDAPSGWNCISCTSTDPFYQAFPRGEATYGSATSGAATHNHTATFVSCGDSSGNGYDPSPADREYPAAVHSHVSATTSPVAASNVPSYRDLKIIQYSGIPSSVPNGVIAIFSTTSLPTDWYAYSSQDNYFLRGFSVDGGTGGGNTHTHNVTITGMTPASATTTGEAKSSTGDSPTHDHDGTGTSDSGNHVPSYLEVVFAFASTTGATTTLPIGLIGMFDATPGASWDVVSDSGDDFYQKFIVGNSTAYGAIGGNATHTHSTITTPATSDTISNADVAPGQDGSTVGHTHAITATFSVVNNLPVYRDVVFAQYTLAANNPPQVDSVSLNASSTIVLSSNSTTLVSATTSVSDPEGCATISTTTAVIYREGATSGCSVDDNNCYIVGSCAQDACSGTNATYTCTIVMDFFADPTDEGSYAQSQGWNSEEWIALITVYDDQDASATGSNAAVEEVDVQSLLAFDLSATSINYGEVNPNETSTEQTVTVSTVGNVPLDVNASGTDMTWSGNNIGVSQQHWSTTTGFIWDDGIALGATSTLIELESGKPTQSPSNATDDIYWKLKVPLDKKGGGPYEGTNIFIEIQD